MRPLIALYVGGMGSRKQNFYNALVPRYGFEEAARDVQDLYLDGKRDEAAAALPDELIDTVALCGPPERVRDRLDVYRDGGRRHARRHADGVRRRGAPRAAAPVAELAELTARLDGDSCSARSATPATRSR